MTNASLIDRRTFEELQASAGDDFVRELVDTFLVEAPQMLSDLRQALREGDANRFRRAAHSLKSNSNTFGATTLGVLARDLELDGLDGVGDGGAQRLDGLEAEYWQVARALAGLVRG
jgi:HPt (histidine-containing phosphotransfer) domain-containing protein